MYMDYTKLWKLLIEREMTKTDLRNLTGMSSRVLAKLSKNQTVTTDTLAKICSVLQCNVGDIMDCVSEKALTLYRCFKQNGVVREQTDLVKIVDFSYDEKQYVVYFVKKTAGKGTHIHCKADKTIYWEQLRIGGMAGPQREEYVLVRPTPQKGDVSLVVLKGKPDLITGLDDNGFVSAQGKVKKDTNIYVITEAEFKTFS